MAVSSMRRLSVDLNREELADWLDELVSGGLSQGESAGVILAEIMDKNLEREFTALLGRDALVRNWQNYRNRDRKDASNELLRETTVPIGSAQPLGAPSPLFAPVVVNVSPIDLPVQLPQEQDVQPPLVYDQGKRRFDPSKATERYSQVYRSINVGRDSYLLEDMNYEQLMKAARYYFGMAEETKTWGRFLSRVATRLRGKPDKTMKDVWADSELREQWKNAQPTEKAKRGE